MDRFGKLVGRALRGRCSLCGEGPLFVGLLTMHKNCPKCGVKFEREPGFFLGSIYINYGLTSLLATIGYVVLFANRLDGDWRWKGMLCAFVVIFPILMHRLARALWLGFDQWHDPQAGEK